MNNEKTTTSDCNHEPIASTVDCCFYYPPRA